MELFKNLTKQLVATLLLAVTVTTTIPNIPEKGMLPECSVCGGDEDERPCPEEKPLL